LIELKNVGKSYSGNLVFGGVSMSIGAGDAIVVMGSNGCGKSTLLKIIAGLLACSDGEITFAPRIKISYVPERFPRLPFKVQDYLLHMGSIQGLSAGEINAYIAEKFKELNIPDNIKRQNLKNCSKGTVQKINIMQALITKPDLLVLDEPFSGVDEKSIDRVVELFAELARNKTAVVLSCHEKDLARKVTENIFLFENQTI